MCVVFGKNAKYLLLGSDERGCVWFLEIGSDQDDSRDSRFYSLFKNVIRLGTISMCGIQTATNN